MLIKTKKGKKTEKGKKSEKPEKNSLYRIIPYTFAIIIMLIKSYVSNGRPLMIDTMNDSYIH